MVGVHLCESENPGLRPIHFNFADAHMPRGLLCTYEAYSILATARTGKDTTRSSVLAYVKVSDK